MYRAFALCPKRKTEFKVSYSHAHVCNFHYNIFASRSLSFFILSHHFREPLCFLSISYYFAIGKPLPCLALLFVSSYCSSLSLPLPFPSIFQFNFASFAPIFFRSDFILIHCSLILIFSERWPHNSSLDLGFNRCLLNFIVLLREGFFRLLNTSASKLLNIRIILYIDARMFLRI